ncbi:type VI secretion system Vgr family protein [Pseudoduganella sp. R-43]|uniref:type VI secretion system Vgr family protein n=1 Tax=unclassified Pseudoduganella TaxID=2637179 RepID=UPI003CF4803C
MNLLDLAGLSAAFSEANRPIRLRLGSENEVLDDALMVQRVTGVETMCGDGIEYRLLCVSTQAGLPIKQFIALPVEVQFVTADGTLRSVCGLVQSASEGQSDGGFATYQLVVRDALAMMELRTNTRVFLDMSETDIIQRLVSEWRHRNPVLARSFDIDLSGVLGNHPSRAFTMQFQESDSQFLKRLMKRRGIAWFIRPGQSSETGSDDMPNHTLVLFDNVWQLPEPGTIPWRYHRADGTEKADAINAWSAERTLAPGASTRHSWDYKAARMASHQADTLLDQGTLGNQFAEAVTDSWIDPPHMGKDGEDFAFLTRLRTQHHEYKSKRFYAESDQRSACVGVTFSMSGHSEIDSHAPEEREFVITELHVVAENNLPKTLGDKVQRLFAVNGWHASTSASFDPSTLAQASDERVARYSNRFTCVRRGIPIVPAYDPRVDLPPTHPMSAIVVADEGEEISCNELGCTKVRILGCTIEDHEHGAGASGTARDSAWIRNLSGWASNGYGMIALCRAGDEVILQFLDGNCDRPVITNRAHNGNAPPPTFSHVGSLPGNFALSGIKSKEFGGSRYNQLRLDDTRGQISAQLASEHWHSEVNLGYLTQPRSDGKGEPRGEGYELASEAAGALRACSLLLTTEQQKSAGGTQLMRDAIIQVLSAALEQVQRQGEYAAEVEANLPETGHDNKQVDDDSKPGAQAHAGHQTQLKEAVDNLERGFNTDPDGKSGEGDQHGKQGILMLGSTAGTALTSQQSITVAANTNLDQVAQRDMNQTTGRRWIHNAAESISLFVSGTKAKLKDTFKIIAAKGNVKLQAQDGEINATAQKDLTITSVDGRVVIQAPEEILLMAGGSYIRIGKDLEAGSPQNMLLKAAKYAMTGAASKSADIAEPPKGNEKMCAMQSASAVANDGALVPIN